MKFENFQFQSNVLVSFDQSESNLEKIKIWKSSLDENQIYIENTLFVFAKAQGFSIQKFKSFLLEREFVEYSKNKDFNFTKILVVDGSLDNTWEILELGFSDVIFFKDTEDFIAYCKDLNKRFAHVNDVLNSKLIRENLIGSSKCWINFLKDVILAAISGKGNILLIGETGTGKELLARLIHTIDKNRSKNNLVILDCTTIVPDLSGSELFGHEKGSFTNASSQREGAFGLVNEGTLFMDEIGDLPIRLQPEFLRVLQEKQFKMVGSNTYKTSDFRLISATNKNLNLLIKNGGFRSDLYYRISDHTFRVPSLKERKEDIPMLARYFLAVALNVRLENAPEFDQEVLAFLMRREYPGNVRELQQLINRIAKNHIRHHLVTPGEVPIQERSRQLEPKKFDQEEGLFQILKSNLLSGLKINDIKRQTMREAIRAALEIHNQDKQRAAASLGITVRAIQKFFQKDKEIE